MTHHRTNRVTEHLKSGVGGFAYVFNRTALDVEAPGGIVFLYEGTVYEGC